ncbi:hypothetical protein SY88_11305 [Clostridiales bacterium PH28_bin88]|nr:hypothetical protein SY88_11305 [Clostridiales bacterium PH28_bin88]
MRVNKLVYIALVLVLFLGVIEGAQAVGYWSVSGKYDLQGNPITPSGKDAGDIKGWMTLQAIMDAYGLSEEEVYRVFHLPPDLSPETPIKDIEKETEEFSPEKLREWITTTRQRT